MSTRNLYSAVKLQDAEDVAPGECRAMIYLGFDYWTGPDYDPCEGRAVRDGLCADHLDTEEDTPAVSVPATPTVPDPWAVPADTIPW